MKAPPNRARLYLASWVAMVTLAVTFVVRGDVLSALGTEFDLSHERQGLIGTAASWGFPVAIMVASPLCDVIGMGRLLGLACLGHLGGVALAIVSPVLGFPALLLAMLLISVADGLVEAVINPLVATLYPGDKTGRISSMHAAWPLGIILGGLLCLALTPFVGWRVKMGLALIPAALYGMLAFRQKFPLTERAASGVPFRAMFGEALRPGYLLLLLCMVFTSITEVGPDQWMGSAMTDITGIRGITFLVYTSAIMWAMRLKGGTLARWLTPYGLLAASSLLAGVGIFWMGHAFTPGVAFAAATVFGVGKTCLWPTLLGVAAERYPRGGSFVLALLSATGMIAAGVSGPLMGALYDHFTLANLSAPLLRIVAVGGRFSPAAAAALKVPADLAAVHAASRLGAAFTFRWVALLPALPLVVFAAQAYRHRSRAGRRTPRPAA